MLQIDLTGLKSDIILPLNFNLFLISKWVIRFLTSMFK